MVKIYFTHVTEQFSQSSIDKLLGFISTERREQIKHYKFDIDKKLSLYSELLIRVIVSQTKKLKNIDIIFSKLKYGKPVLKDFPNLYFNISHTSNAIVVAISDYPVGVDIEPIRIAKLKIAERFFVPAELSYITQSTHHLDKRFYEIWTKKEAYIKCIGRGLSLPLKAFDVLSNSIELNMMTLEKYGYLISSYSEGIKKSVELIEVSEEDINIMAISSFF